MSRKTSPRALKPLDPGSLKALAHPIRVELFRRLSEGSANATQLAEQLGESTGTVSWHLRQLARFGFIEDDPDRRSARERWWRAAVQGTSLDIREHGIKDDPVTLEAARWYARDWARRDGALVEQWIASAEQWSEDWMGASTLNQNELELTAAQLLALRHELAEVIERHRVAPGDNPDPEARRVHLAIQAFPVGSP